MPYDCLWKVSVFLLQIVNNPAVIECLPRVGYAVRKFLMWNILEGYTGLNTRNN